MFRLDDDASEWDRDAYERGELGLCEHCGMFEHSDFLFDDPLGALCAECIDAVEQTRTYDDANEAID